jgi:hypothetical protein
LAIGTVEDRTSGAVTVLTKPGRASAEFSESGINPLTHINRHIYQDGIIFR